jgi:energy-coupling factor transporter ATP-binding protein EcfA2
MISMDVRLTRGDFALDVAFSSDARVTALFGPSGSGKSTLIELIGGRMTAASRSPGRFSPMRGRMCLLRRASAASAWCFRTRNCSPISASRKTCVSPRFFQPPARVACR